MLRGPRAPRRGRGWTSCCGLATRPSGLASGLFSRPGHLWETPVCIVWVLSASGTEGTGLGGSASPWKWPTSAKSPGETCPQAAALSPCPVAPWHQAGQWGRPVPLSFRADSARTGCTSSGLNGGWPCSEPLRNGAGGREGLVAQGQRLSRKLPLTPAAARWPLCPCPWCQGTSGGPQLAPHGIQGPPWQQGPGRRTPMSRVTTCQEVKQDAGLTGGGSAFLGHGKNHCHAQN